MAKIKVAQFGEGNFLRTFVDLYFETLNQEGHQYEVSIIKPVTFGSLDAFRAAQCQYHVILRGVANGKPSETVYPVHSVKEVIDPFEEKEKFYSLAKDPDLKLIVSNTTEAGIATCDKDGFDDSFENIAYPAKLTHFLYERFLAKKGNLYLLPVELIPNNGKALEETVSFYLKLWNLPQEFQTWNQNNVYCSTLVDRIVSGHPKDPVIQKHIKTLIGKDDPLFSIGEPFGLWVVEKKGDVSSLIKEGHHNIDVILTEDVATYKRRKVRVLNGSHTNLVPLALWSNMVTVYDCMKDEKLSRFVEETLKEEIIPFVSENIEETSQFAEDVKLRFLNPYLNHQLTSIALNSISKWKERDLPSFHDYFLCHGKIPAYMTLGFSALIALYAAAKKNEGRYEVSLPSRVIEVKDDPRYFDYFIQGGTIKGFLSDVSIWGTDLTTYPNLFEEVERNVAKLLAGESLL